ncbi:MAG: hypothetical protein AAFP84_08810 [Actinomycetota bacterium]
MNERLRSHEPAPDRILEPAHDSDLDAIDAEQAADTPAPNLDAIDADLDGVDAALTRLADGTYWNDELTGEPLPDHVLETNPTTRRVTA